MIKYKQYLKKDPFKNLLEPYFACQSDNDTPFTLKDTHTQSQHNHITINLVSRAECFCASDQSLTATENIDCWWRSPWAVILLNKSIARTACRLNVWNEEFIVLKLKNRLCNGS